MKQKSCNFMLFLLSFILLPPFFPDRLYAAATAGPSSPADESRQAREPSANRSRLNPGNCIKAPTPSGNTGRSVKKKRPEFMPSSKIRKGMKGYGLTVFGGQKIEKFQVEVLGVLRNKGPGRDLILVRAQGGPLDKTGVIAGMSGSPVFINDKLIGALAFAWSYSKEAIAGIQPIRAMLDLADRAPEKRAESPAPAPAEGNTTRAGASGDGLLRLAAAPLSQSIRPIRCPVFLDGFTESAVSFLELPLSRMGLVCVSSGPAFTGFCASAPPRSPSSSSSSSSMKPGGAPTVGRAVRKTRDIKAQIDKLVAGQAIGVIFVRGDLNAAVTGTLTLRQGSRILAFGHPLMNLGDIRLPLCAADIQTCLPSLALSFKMSNALDVVGTLYRDGATAIVGRLGGDCPLIPVNVRLLLPDHRKSLSYNIQVARHRLLTPMFIRAALRSIMETANSRIGPATITVSTRIFFSGHKPVYTSNTFTTKQFPSLAAASGLAPLFAMMNTTIEDLCLESLQITLKTDNEVRAAAIEGVRWLKGTYAPGEELRGAVVFRVFQAERTFKPFRIRLPLDLPEGRLKINVTSGHDTLLLERRRDPDKFKPRTIDELGQFYSSIPDYRSFDVSFDYGRCGASLEGRNIPQPPPSLLALIEKSRGLTFEKLTAQQHVTVNTDWVTEGSSSFTVEIKKKPLNYSVRGLGRTRR